MEYVIYIIIAICFFGIGYYVGTNRMNNLIKEVIENDKVYGYKITKKPEGN